MAYKNLLIPFTLLALLLALAAAFGETTVLADTTFVVNSTLDEPDAAPGDGICRSTISSACTLRAAIMEANMSSGEDTVRIRKGVYKLTLRGAKEDHAKRGDLDIVQNMIIQGAGTAATVIDGDKYDRVFEIFRAHVEISNLTVQHGFVNNHFQGGGISNGGRLYLTNVIIKENHAGAGGGIENHGAIHLEDVSLVSNLSTGASPGDSSGFVPSQGGGLESGGNAFLLRVLITGNQANCVGGGISASGKLTLNDSEIENNSTLPHCTYDNGGGVNIGPDSDVRINNTTITNNSAGRGGGLNFFGGHAQWLLTNVTISGNRATLDDSAGVRLQSGPGAAHLGLMNVTIANNAGTGITLVLFTDSVTAQNSIIAVNEGPDCSGGTIVSLGHNLESGTTCGFSSTGDLVSTDPLLLPLANNGGFALTSALSSASLAIDGGAPGGCLGPDGTALVSDERGSPRPLDGDGNGSAICDIGAFEY